MDESPAKSLADLLTQRKLRIVLAESCTCGLISAELGGISGISNHLCGSAVVYREETKIGWLNVKRTTLAESSAESPESTAAITEGVLRETPEADFAIGITGHLGPNAPAEIDGVVHIAVWGRDGERRSELGAETARLVSEKRVDRQREAANRTLSFARVVLERP